MRPPPPTSTLFPYTTLFRSPHNSGLSPFMPGRIVTVRVEAKRAGADMKRAMVVELTGNPADPLWRDRKSTRLNSSHVKISYAVFCLKKKKNKKLRNIA